MNVWWWGALAATFAIFWKGTAPKAVASNLKPYKVPSVFDPREEKLEGTEDELPDVSGHVEYKAPTPAGAGTKLVPRNPFSENGQSNHTDGTLSPDAPSQVAGEEEFNLDDLEEIDGDDAGPEGV
jgi:hypothetical protein